MACLAASCASIGEGSGESATEAEADNTLAAPSTAPDPALSSTDATEVESVLRLETWVLDANAIWQQALYDPFHELNPSILIQHSPTVGVEYNDQLRARLDAGTAGDIITCRPFDQSLALFDAGHLLDLSDQPFLDQFDEADLRPWQTDDSASTFCVPVASVSHVFYYNADALDELGRDVPETMTEFFDLLAFAAEDDRYVPLAIGLSGGPSASNALFQNMGPTFWGADEGRQRVVAGTTRLDDQPFIDLLQTMADLQPYLPDAVEFLGGGEARELFVSGQALIYPGGSWEIGRVEMADFEVGVFAPPRLEGGNCAVINHPDGGWGLNPAGDVEHGMKFLEWVASADFAARFAESVPGAFSLHSQRPRSSDPLADQMSQIMADCDTSIRLTAELLERGPENTEQVIWEVANEVVLGSMTPADGAAMLQASLDSWYEPPPP